MNQCSKSGSTPARSTTRPVTRWVALAVLALMVSAPVARADGGVGGWPPPIKITGSGGVGG